ncbi:ABC transporter permease [Melghirimyces algeriensis]|uniref:ABC-2 family transporter protein n=1 Tax=Melghirimyces algeriensis TaxID=910412 RepID=A0A521ESX0_9BACL|nr:ABC transporter permease subunit [Melghirimyces algeriensis]SMO87007.1 ABC-2 family transporter protein [Melghirimyces algeriensis]
MYELILSEWERIWARKKTWISLAVFIIYLGISAYSLSFFLIGFYTPELETSINSLNFSVFFLREVDMVLTFIILPMLFVDCFGGEYHSGALRMVLIRPQSRIRLLGAKWIAMTAVIVLFLTVTFVVGQICGWSLSPIVDQVTFYPQGEHFTTWGALGYSVLFYLTFLSIYLVYLGIASLISTVFPNAILSFFFILAIVIGTLYPPDGLWQFFLFTSEKTFALLNGTGVSSFLIALPVVLGITYGTVWWLWNRKSWVR